MSTEVFEIIPPPVRCDYTLQEVAQMLRCSPSSVRKLIAEGELRYYRVRRAVRIRPEWVDEYRDAQQ